MCRTIDPEPFDFFSLRSVSRAQRVTRRVLIKGADLGICFGDQPDSGETGQKHLTHLWHYAINASLVGCRNGRAPPDRVAMGAWRDPHSKGRGIGFAVRRRAQRKGPRRGRFEESKGLTHRGEKERNRAVEKNQKGIEQQAQETKTLRPATFRKPASHPSPQA